MKLILAFLLFPIIAFGQLSVKNEYSDSLSGSNAAKIKLAITGYLAGKISNWKDYEEEHWSITSIYSRYDDSTEGKLFEKTALPLFNRYKLYRDSVEYIRRTVHDTLARELLQFPRLTDSLKKYKSSIEALYQQYQDREKQSRSLKYFLVDFIFIKKGSTEPQDAEVYSFHISNDFQVRSALHVSKEPLR